MATESLFIRRASLEDCSSIAEVHVDSIRSLGARAYAQSVIEDWARPRTGDIYQLAMENGETFFVAVERGARSSDRLIGFSSYRIEDGKHRTAIYVRGDSARRKVGTALFRAAENEARSNGARELHVASSLCAVRFYKANGFEQLKAGEHILRTGRKMACVYMRKLL